MASFSSRETTVYAARVAEQAERFDDMVESMKYVAKLDVELTIEERNLPTIAYKSLIGSRRASWRVLSSMEHEEEPRGNEQKAKVIKDYRQKVEMELTNICNDITALIDEHLIPSCTTGKGIIIGTFLKSRQTLTRKSLLICPVKHMSWLSESNLNPAHPTRLGLALNFSVFYCEILNSPERACHLAKLAFDAAIGDLDSMTEESYKDSAMIMQLLRDNLTLWKNDIPDDAGDDAAAD